MKNIGDFVKNIGKKIARASAYVAIAALPYIASPQTASAQTTYDGVPDSEWQDQLRHPDIRSEYLGYNELDYDGSGDANNDEVVDMNDVQAVRDGNDSYRADVARPFGIVDEADAQAIEDYVNGTGKIIGKDFYTIDKGITNEERKAYIVDKYNYVLMKIVNTKNDGLGDNVYYPGFECYNYAELSANYFQGWTDPDSFFNKYWLGKAKEVIDTSYNYNKNGIFNIQCNTADHATYVGDPHTSLEFPLVGDLTKEENILRIDAQTGRVLNFGDNLLAYDDVLITNWIGNTERWGPIRGPRIINKIQHEDETDEILFENPDYNFHKDLNGFEEIKDNNRIIDLDVYKNGYINIATKVPGRTNLEIFAADGKLVNKKSFDVSYGDNMINLDFNPQNNGMYIYVVTDKDGNKDVVKTVK